MSFTTPQLLVDYQRRTGLVGGQVLLLVARCGLVRHLSDNYSDRFVLKGGSLLYHCYQAPRVSFVDTDFADTSRAVADPEEMRDIVTFETEDGYKLTNTPEGDWKEQGSILKGRNLTFSLDNIEIARPRARHVNISVSFRRGERIIVPDHTVWFDADGLLQGDNLFKVNGLVREEVAAEKVLGWCTKVGLAKHFADLAILARDHATDIDRSLASDLIEQKFDIERTAPESRQRYESLGLSKPADLNRYFLDETRLNELRASWPQALTNVVVLKATERKRDDTVADVERVIELVRDYWGPVIEQLAS